MILRPYQEELVEKAEKALRENKNTLAVAATGSGKTIMLSALAGRIGGKTLILQHRDELTDQNESKFLKINPRWRTSRFNASEKDFSGQAVFSMVQTLTRHVEKIPAFDHLVIDEAHHAAAISYLKILRHLECMNPNLIVSGWTATPMRGDKLGLLNAGFDNVCSEISIDNLVDMGFLVEPKCYARHIDGFDLGDVKRSVGGEYDMEQVAEMMDIEVSNNAIFRQWESLAGDRKTIVFCPTVKYSETMTQLFQANGIKAESVSAETPSVDRQAILKDFDHGNLQVLFNVAVLTEGYDSQPVSCIVLLRPCSFKSTMIQMIGRGLRIVDQSIYPNIIKDDCIILDFGESLRTHGNLISDKGLYDSNKICPVCKAEVPPKINPCPDCGYDFTPDYEDKICPDCGYINSPNALICKDCGHEFEKFNFLKQHIDKVEMIALNIMNKSPYKWLDLFGNGKAMIASGFDACVGIFSRDGIAFTAMGKVGKGNFKKIHRGDKKYCITKADDFIRENEMSSMAQKSKRWLKDNLSEKQLDLLKRLGYDQGALNQFTKYQAACHLNFQWNKREIERILFS
jgi:superfamily II DNA or RNA helicase/ribosomal protein L40E